MIERAIMPAERTRHLRLLLGSQMLNLSSCLLGGSMLRGYVLEELSSLADRSGILFDEVNND